MKKRRVALVTGGTRGIGSAIVDELERRDYDLVVTGTKRKQIKSLRKLGTGRRKYLLTMCDSCIRSKTSINFGHYKNQLGGFYPPERIILDISMLNTLPEREFRSGIGEMWHYFCVSGRVDVDWAKRRVEKGVKKR